MRLAPVMLALLLALSPGAVAVQASAPGAPAPDSGSAGPTVVDGRSASADADRFDRDATQSAPGTAQSSPDRNTTAIVTLGAAPTRTAFDSPSLAVGSALAMDRGAMRTELSAESLRQRLQAADSVEKKKQVLNRYRYRIENRIISLKAKERQVTGAFSNGTISDREYLRTLGQLNTEATAVERMIEAMQTQSQNVPRSDMTTAATTLRGKLVALQGPVRDHLSSVLQGRTSPTRVYVATTDAGIALSTITDGTYVREILRQDRRNPGASLDLSHIEAQNAVLEQYAWASQNMDSDGTRTFLYGSTNIYSVSVSHRHGDLIAYLDAGTEEIFKEVQHKQLTGERHVPPGPAVTNTTTSTFGPNLTLTVNRTYSGGPLRVKLTNSTGGPVRGAVTVGGDPVGRTSEDGVLWTLGPAERFRVSATHEGATVNVTTTPVEA